MAIAYKGFEVYICDPNTYENVAYLRNIAITICTTKVEIPGYINLNDVEAVIANVNGITDYRNSILLSVIDGNILGNIQEVYPGAVLLQIPTEYIGYKLKLLNPTSGNYAISTSNLVAPQSGSTSARLSSHSYRLLFSDGTVASNGSNLPVGSQNESGFLGYSDFDGEVKTSAWMYPYHISYSNFSRNYNLYANVSAQSIILNQQVANWFNQITPIIEHTDPYTPGGPTGPGGGDGTGPEGIINDDIDFPTQLTISASNANFISIWTPTLDQVQTLAKWMWTTDPLKWEFWQKLLQNPLDLIFSLTIMPVPIYHPDEGGTPAEGELVAQTDPLSLGWQDTGIRMDWVPEQYVTIDMGTINLEEVWGAFLDYEPYTKIDIFLPYIGTKQLDTNDCMPRSISLRYIIDLATGTCVALIKCDNSVYYHFSGNCASQIPITVNQCQEIVRGLMTMAVGAATFAIGGPMGAGAHASKAAIAKGAAMKAGGAAMVGSGADSAAKGVNVSRSGVIGAAAGLMDVQTPYLIISRPRQAVPEDQNKYTGYPSFITEQIGDLTGYTEVQMIHLHNMSCTDEEYKEIDSLLTQGVII